MSRFFLHAPAVLFAVILVAVGMVPVIVPYFTKPADRGDSFVEGYSSDYIGYTSYINEGMYGRNTVRILSAPADIPQEPTTIHILYIGIGKIGRILQLSPMLAYHLSRTVIGITFILSAYAFFLFLLKKRWWALMATGVMFLTTSVSWYIPVHGIWTYQALDTSPFASTVVLRAISRQHYDLGSIVLIWIGYAVLSRRRLGWKQRVTTCAVGLLLGIIHSPSGIILLPLLCLYGFSVWARGLYQRDDGSFFLLLVLAIGLGLVSSYLGTRGYPWGTVYQPSFYFRLTDVLQYVVTFGPVFLLGIVGLVFGLIKPATREASWYLLLWVTVQFSFFFLLAPFFDLDAVRFIQTSAYLVAFVYGVTILAGYPNRGTYWYLVMGLFILVSSSTYVHDLSKLLAASPLVTHTYPLLEFPPRPALDAYQFLLHNTPTESVVLANVEAANLLQIYSHNAVLGGSWQGWQEGQARQMERIVDAIFFDQLDEATMRWYFHQYQVRYVYAGYQERRSSVFERHPDLFVPMYHNTEVTIYAIP